MRKICLVLLCLALLLPNTVWVQAADTETVKTVAPVEEIQPLSQLGVLDTTDPGAMVTKNTLVNGLNAVVGSGTGERYFEGHNTDTPLLYGQAVMILMDVMGYTPYVKMQGYNTSDIIGYFDVARRIRLTDNISVPANQQMTVNDYAPLLYNALIKVPMMRILTIQGDNVTYQTDKSDTLLTCYMKLVRVEGVVSGLDQLVTDTRDSGRNGKIKIGASWYSYTLQEELFPYFGRRVEAYVTTNDRPELKCMYIKQSSNKIIQLTSDDIDDTGTQKTSISYYKGDRIRKIPLSETVDVVYNRELLRDYTISDLTQSDAAFTMIDNDTDGAYDVVLIDRYKSYVVFSSTPSTNRILDLYGNSHDLTEYFSDGYKLYNHRNESVGLNVPARNDVISYLQAASGQITYMRVTAQQASGMLQSQREDGKYLTIDDVEYTCTYDYMHMQGKSTEIAPGDMITAFLDCNDRIVDIRKVKDSAEAAYLLAVAPGVFGEVRLKILDNDGAWKVVTTSDTIRFNGKKMTAAAAFKTAAFVDNSGKFKDQLILYHTNRQGEISYIDTAEEVAVIGSRGNEGFTLDYDYEKNGPVYNVKMNNKSVLGSKYTPNTTTTVFGVVEGKLEYSYVQVGTANPSGANLPENTVLNLKMYNVDKNYTPEYIVRMQEHKTVGGWVGFYESPYIVNQVYRSISETGEERYDIEVYNTRGEKKILYASQEHGSIKTENWNQISLDERLLDIELKDLPKGAIVLLSNDFYGVSSMAIQCVPRADGSEVIFEKIDGVDGTSFGITQRTFNGDQLFSYGLVVDRVDLGIVVNNHLPTEDELAEGASFPMESWSRTLPLVDTDTVFLYEKSLDRLTVETADCIIPGDHVFMKRNAANYDGIYVYRD